MKNELIEICKEKSIQLLKSNSRKEGVLASGPCTRAKDRNYESVFSRDAAISSLGMIASGDKELTKTAKAGIFTLAKHQAKNGQIPNFVSSDPFRVDFWKIDCIDSTLWWLLAVKFYDKHTGGKKIAPGLKNKVNKALNWLKCREHPEDGLLVQGEASDWADIMPRSGKVLYTNALWYNVKKEYGLADAEKTKKYFNVIFDPARAKKEEVPRCQLATYKLSKKKKQDVYLSFVNYYFWGTDHDVFGNALANIFGLADRPQKNIIIESILKKQNKKMPVPALYGAIQEKDALWRPYMNNHKQNKPNQYHNGGIWPFISSFWAVALAEAGKKTEAKEELLRTAQFNAINNWQFNEWFHGKNGKPMGMGYQSWNAGAFLWAYHSINSDLEF